MYEIWFLIKCIRGIIQILLHWFRKYKLNKYITVLKLYKLTLISKKKFVGKVFKYLRYIG